MKLPENSIGVTDIIAYRECARRFEFGMRRHTAAGEHPQATSPSNAYGSAFHEAAGYLGEMGDCPDSEVVNFVMGGRYGRWLSPDDIERLRIDLRTYRERDYLGVSTVMSERELRVPLMEYKGERYFYRFRVDRLYRSQRDPGTFVQIDYKTSRHPKTEHEIHSDPQLSAYAFGLHEMFPEIERLVQVYDQLNYGAVTTTRTPEQIELIKEWLTTNAVAILEDDNLDPTYNSFCAYCPIVMDCPIVTQLTDYALAEISAMMPEVDDGGRVIQDGRVLTGEELEPYVEQLEKVAAARSILNEFDGRVRGTLRELPVDTRLRLGFKTSTPKVSSWPPEALEALAEILGDDFWRMAKISKRDVGRLTKDKQALVNSLAVEHAGAPRMTRVKEKGSAFGDAPDAPES